MFYKIRKILYPEIFQGKNKKKNYFEGWYFKIVDKKQKNVFAIIPGISFSKNKKDSHSFIQIINGKNLQTYYYKYKLSDFDFSEKTFLIKISKNIFSKNRIILNLVSEESNIMCDLMFKNLVELKRNLLFPGVMGPFSWIPFMECYHGVVSMYHKIFGWFEINNSKIDFNEGIGYTEKDWGKSFPESWLWLQCNNFLENFSIMLSVAKIPFLGKSFTGFLVVVYFNRKIYKFTTYSFAKIRLVSLEKNFLKLEVYDFKHKLEISVNFSDGGKLVAPKSGNMKRIIKESIDTNIEVDFMHKKEILFTGKGVNCGFEMVGDIKNLFNFL